MTATARPRALVIGARGQVGWELVRTLAPLADVTALDRRSLDLTDADALRSAVRHHKPQVIVNAAAYTHVDQAEAERELAFRVNGEAPSVLAEAAAGHGALLVHYSTDYVFSGEAHGTEERPSHSGAPRAYTESDAPDPRTAYGESKLRGDRAVLDSEAYAYVFRVGWVYGQRRRNFLTTVTRLVGKGDDLRIVADQHGGPTWSRTIAEATALAVGQWLDARRTDRPAPLRGLYHLAPPDHTTWHGFAQAIVEHMHLPASQRPSVLAITTREYPTPAKRPAWSVLSADTTARAFGIALPDWRSQLSQCMEAS